MARWKLFNKTKGKKETRTEVETMVHRTEKSDEKAPLITPAPKTTPTKEYNETLYSTNSTIKKRLPSNQEIKQPLKRTSWESPRTIEQSIDNMGPTQTENEINKKVDRTLTKKKLKL
jgi:hypothetical protein